MAPLIPPTSICESVFDKCLGLSLNKILLFQLIPWLDHGKKQKAREALRFLRKTGLKLLQDREAQITRGETVPEDILTQICRYKGQCLLNVELNVMEKKRNNQI